MPSSFLYSLNSYFDTVCSETNNVQRLMPVLSPDKIVLIFIKLWNSRKATVLKEKNLCPTIQFVAPCSIMGTYAKMWVLYIGLYLLFLLRRACKFNRTLFYAGMPCAIYCNLLPYSKNVRAVCTFSVNHSLFFPSQQAKPTQYGLWHAQLIPTEELVIFLFAVTLAERMIPAPGFVVVNIG
jgi:hypothetical protein